MWFHTIDPQQQVIPGLGYVFLIAGSSTPLLGSRISEWNTALPQFANGFSNDHPDISVSVYDVNTVFTTVLDNPQKYGFKDAVSICQTSDCIWADTVHSTFAMHKILALDIARFLKNPSATVAPTPQPPASSSASRSTHSSTYKRSTYILAGVGMGIFIWLLSM